MLFNSSYSIIKFIKIFIRRLLPIIMPILWVFVGLNRLINLCFHLNSIQTDRNLLFIVQNSVAADYAKTIVDILKDNNKCNIFLTNDQIVNPYLTKQIIIDIINLEYINIFISLLKYWDLIIFVNHPWGLGIWFAPFIKKIYINHGICTGKVNNDKGEDGVYGPCRVIRPFNRPYYHKMFCSSKFEKKYAILQNSKLRKRMVVTGFLKSDIIITLNKQREKIRTSLGFNDKDFLIHIISTWGNASLFQTIGEELLIEAAKLTDKYHFIFSLHPRHDEFGDLKNRRRKAVFDKYKKMGIQPQDNVGWDNYVVACDMAISDHSSLCLFYLLLEKPLLLVNIPQNNYIKGSVFHQLCQIAPVLSTPKKLYSSIENAKFEAKSGKLYEFGKSLIDYPGTSAERYTEQIYRILNYEN